MTLVKRSGLKSGLNWELCIADGSPAGESVERILKAYARKDSRIRYKILGENLGISGNTNAALEMAEGDYIVLADHDDIVTENALYECAKAVNENPGADVLYSDEDKLDMDGGALFDPHFKPDFNPDLLTSVNYICHLFRFYPHPLIMGHDGAGSCLKGIELALRVAGRGILVTAPVI